MASETGNAGSDELKKLNPEAIDFVPVPPTRKAAEVFKANDILNLPARAKKRRSRPRRPLPHFVAYDSPTKTLSEDISTTPTSYKSYSSKTSIVGSQTDPVQFAVATNKSLVPADAGNESQDKEKSSPLYGNALTWKSDNVKAKEEFARIRRNVRTMAPEQFADRAKPSGEPANIVPRSLSDYQWFKSESVADRMKELAVDMKKMGDLVAATENMEKDGIPREKRVPKSYFGPGGKAFKDARGPVLAQPTIWSQEWMDSDAPKASWPTRAERLEDGDSRENTQVQVRSGRHLPMPRYPQDLNKPYVSFKDRPAIPQRPLDQTGPIYRNSNGDPVGPTPAEVDAANEEMNNDPTFEAQALPLLGNDLMNEVGRWQKPVVPPWQERQRQEAAAGYGAGNLQQGLSGMQGSGPAATPARGGGSTANSQPLSTPSYSGQQSDMSSGPLPQSAGIQHGQAPAPRHYSFASSDSSMVDMTGWVLIGRHTIAGTNIGENFWLTPWGETVVYRDVW